MRLTYSALALLLLAAACGDDDDTPGSFDSAGFDGPVTTVDGAVTSFDAPTTPSFDAPITPSFDAPTTPTFDAVPSADSAPPTYDAAIGVVCGDTVCDQATQQCCRGASATCIGLADQCTGIVVGCDGPEDCSGSDVCCGAMNGMSISSACGPADQACQYQLCGSATDCPAEAANCCDFSFVGVRVCMAQCLF